MMYILMRGFEHKRFQNGRLNFTGDPHFIVWYNKFHKRKWYMKCIQSSKNKAHQNVWTDTFENDPRFSERIVTYTYLKLCALPYIGRVQPRVKSSNDQIIIKNYKGCYFIFMTSMNFITLKCKFNSVNEREKTSELCRNKAWVLH